MYLLVLCPYSKLCFYIIDSNFLLVKIRKQHREYNNIYKQKLIFYHTTMFPFTYFLKDCQCWGERNLSHIILKCFSLATQHWKEQWSQSNLHTDLQKIFNRGITAILCCDFISLMIFHLCTDDILGWVHECL